MSSEDLTSFSGAWKEKDLFKHLGARLLTASLQLNTLVSFQLLVSYSAVHDANAGIFLLLLVRLSHSPQDLMNICQLLPSSLSPPHPCTAD